MKRRRSSSSDGGALAVPLSMIDVSWLILMFALVQANFSVEAVPLPSIVSDETSSIGQQKEPFNQLILHLGGEVTYQGSSIPFDALADQIKSEPDQARQILLSIERDGDGRISDQLPRLLHDLSHQGIVHRVRIQYERNKQA